MAERWFVLTVRRFAIGALALLVLVTSLMTSTCLVSKIGGAFSRRPEELKGGLSPGARRLFEAAFEGLSPSRLIDYHTHVVGLGVGDTGTFVNPEMRTWVNPIMRFKFAVYMSASGIENEENADREYVERLVALARGVDLHGRYLLLGFDKHYRKDGSVNLEKTEFYVPNRYVFALAKEFPDVFLPVMSVHPYRKDAIAELDKWAALGGRFVKWLPNAMGMDPADPACDVYYEKMKEHGLVLISHAGEEQAVEAEEDQKLGNPLKLRRPLDAGVKVIVAHAASLGEGEDYDDPERAEVSNFQLFMRLMDDERYVGRVFGDISAMIQWNRLGEPLSTMLSRQDLHGRLVNGSDYPLPAINALVSTSDLADEGYITEDEEDQLNEIYDYNPLLFDFVLKRSLKHPESGARFDASIFLAHDFFPLDPQEGEAPPVVDPN